MNVSEYTRHTIISICNEKGISIKKLAEKSNMSPSTIENILTGLSKNPGIMTIKKICDGLEISISKFFDTDIQLD